MNGTPGNPPEVFSGYISFWEFLTEFMLFSLLFAINMRIACIQSSDFALTENYGIRKSECNI